MIRRPLALAALAAALVAAPRRAPAQFRPPPLTEAQQLIRSAEEARTDAAKREAAGDGKGAEGYYRKAIERYQRALAVDPNALDAAEGIGQAGNALRDFALVARVLGPIRAAHPDDVGVTFYLGTALYKLRHLSEASPLLQAVSAANRPDYFIAHYYLGNCALALGDGAGAAAALERYLQARPEPLARSDFEVWALIGRAQLALGAARPAREAFERAQRGRPPLMAIQLGLVGVLELEGKIREAITLLQQLTRKEPKAREPREHLARLYLDVNDLRSAEQLTLELLRAGSTPSAQLLMGDLRLRQGQPKPAEAAFRAALKGAPALTAAEVGLARALLAQGRIQEGLGLLERASKARAYDPQLWGALGSSYRRTGRYQEAIEAHERVLKLLPALPEGHLLLGADHFATGQWDAAIGDYDRALKIAPKDRRALHFLALTLSRRAQVWIKTDLPDNAIVDLRRAFDLEPSAAIGRSLGAVLLHDRQFAEAQTVLARAAGQRDADWRNRLLLGYAYLGSGKPKEALAAFESAGKLAKDGASSSEAYAGWALAKVELGDYDTAVSRMQTPGAAPAAQAVVQANLPRALLRRAVSRIQDGDAAGAAKDVDAALALPGSHEGASGRIAGLVRALIALERGQYADASTGIRKALGARETWVEPYARVMLEAYVGYRHGLIPAARKQLQALQRSPEARALPWLAQLGQALKRREGELAYGKGSLAEADKAFKDAAAADPLNPYVTHNLAVVRYRKRDLEPAVEAWKRVADVVPEAHLNLGIHAQERQKDMRAATELYQRYVAAGGSRAALVREWIERLRRIYGIDAPAAPADPTAPARKP